jgi:hypothetical protein
MTAQHLTASGKVRVRLTSGMYARYPRGEVLDAAGVVIGEACSYTYGGAAFAVHTELFAGHVRFAECAFIGGTKGILVGR